MDKILDKYVWQARVWPGFLIFLPAIAIFLAWTPDAPKSAQPIISAAVGAGIVALIASVARGAGKRAEVRLVREWGALPTTILLRHSDKTIDEMTKSRYRNALIKMVSGLKMPSAESEAADGPGADQAYQASARYLLSQTRDKKRFPLIFAENMDYGFRRNLYGLRPLGIGISLLAVGACAWKVLLLLHAGITLSALTTLCLVGSIAMLCVWMFAINKDWVWQGGVAYALRLFEAIDQLQVASKTA